jgi:hypothetical protein
MSPSSITPWNNETSRLITARERYLSSLEAIQDIVEIATEPIAKLDRNAKIRIVISDEGVEGAGEDTAKVALALSNLLQSMVARSIDQGIQDSAQIDPGTPEGRAYAEANLFPLFDKFASEIPKQLDPDTLAKLVRVNPPRKRVDMLLSSLLTAAVSDFEVLFSTIVGYFYRVHPEALKSQDSPIPWSEIEQYATIDDLKSYYIDARVSKLMWQGFDEWMKWIDQQLRIKFQDSALDPDSTNEIFQRRHIIIHNGGRVSRQYLAKNSGLNHIPALDEVLKVDRDYLAQAIDRLTVLGISLVHLTMRKLCKGNDNHERVDRDINAIVYSLLEQRRWEVAERVASIALPHMSVEASRLAVKVNQWIAQGRVGGRDAIAKEVTRWDVSALEDKFKLARLTLLEDSSAVDMAKRMLEEGNLGFEELSTWPLFEKLYHSMDFEQSSADADVENDSTDTPDAELSSSGDTGHPDAGRNGEAPETG